jgi:hypothetical protein
MARTLYVLGLCLLATLVSPAYADACADLQAAIAKATALKGAMQREAAPILSLPQIPPHSQAACAASQSLRDHIVALTRLIDPKCLTEEQRKNLTTSLNKTMVEANNNISLFCN